MKKISFILSLMSIFNVSATEVVLFGGGGEPKGAKTIFDKSLESFGEAKLATKFNVVSVFNGGHTESEKIIAEKISSKNQQFSKDNYFAMVDAYVKKIKNNEIKPGEQLMVVMDTHGGERSSKYATHSIAMSGAEVTDFSKISGEKSNSLDKLKELTEVADKFKIKLAIVDLSCHSGNSLPLANENTCVITSSGPDHFAYAQFGERLYGEIRPGVSLEQAFLNARKDYTLPSFPMISTTIGKDLNKELYGLLTPYLNTTNESGDADKLTPYINSAFEKNGLCIREQEFEKLIKILEDFVKINGALESQFSGTKDLIVALKEYKAFQDQTIENLTNLGKPLLNKTSTIVNGIAKKDKAGKMITPTEVLTWEDIVFNYPNSSISYFEDRLKTEKGSAEIASLKNSILKFKNIDVERQRILNENPGLTKIKDELKQMRVRENKTWEAGMKVQELSNALFNKKYEDELKINKKKKDPCRDFVF